LKFIHFEVSWSTKSTKETQGAQGIFKRKTETIIKLVVVYFREKKEHRPVFDRLCNRIAEGNAS